MNAHHSKSAVATPMECAKARCNPCAIHLHACTPSLAAIVVLSRTCDHSFPPAGGWRRPRAGPTARGMASRPRRQQTGGAPRINLSTSTDDWSLLADVHTRACQCWPILARRMLMGGKCSHRGWSLLLARVNTKTSRHVGQSSVGSSAQFLTTVGQRFLKAGGRWVGCCWPNYSENWWPVAGHSWQRLLRVCG